MPQPKTKERIIKPLLVIFFLLLIRPAYSRGLFQDKAVLYRKLGYKAQMQGELKKALEYYHKSLLIDPDNAVVYNDLGVVYEMLGDSPSAEEVYNKALILEPGYAGVYSNLALLYEKRGDLLKAAAFWFKRIKYSKGQDDLWAIKAKQRVCEISQIIPAVKEKYIRIESELLEKDVVMMKDIGYPYELDSDIDFKDISSQN